MTTSYDVANDLIRAVGGTPNASITRAVAIWIRAEGATIIGNNPLNIHYGTACTSASGFCPISGVPGIAGNRYAGPGDKNVAVYASYQDGINATASLIKNHYAGIRNAILAGSGLDLIRAVGASAWGTSETSLLSLWNSQAAYNWTIGFRTGMGTGTTTSSPPGGTTISDTGLAAFQALLDKLGINSDPTHVLTLSEAQKIADQYGVVQGSDVWQSIVDSFVGKTVADASHSASTSPDPLKAIGDFAGFLTGLLGFFIDPENWLLIGALAIGGFLAWRGTVMLIESTGEPLGGPKPVRTTTQTLTPRKTLAGLTRYEKGPKVVTEQRK